MASNNSLPDQTMCSQTANMASFDDSTESDNESEYFDASEYLENNDDSYSDDDFQDARDSFNDEVDPAEDPLPSAAATNSVLSEKRKFDNVAQDDQATDSNSPVASSSPCGASFNQPKKLKTVAKFGQTSVCGAMKVPQALSSIKTTAPTVGLFKTAMTFSFGATMHDANTVFNVSSTSSLDDDNKENDDRNPTFGQIPREMLAGAEEIEIKTGGENEDTVCQSKGRLYVLGNTQSWKERGVGIFRLKKHDNESRLIMRTGSVFHLILNAKLFPGMSVSIAQDRFLRFAVFETVTNEEGRTETKLVNYALKLVSATTADEIFKRITSCIPSQSAPKRKLEEILGDDDDDDDDDKEPPFPKAQLNRRLSSKKKRN